MKKSLTKILSVMLGVLLTFGVVTGCGKDETKENPFDTTKSVELRLAAFHDKDARIKYGGAAATAFPEYVAANGKTYRNGDITPVWEALASKLNFTITDVATDKGYTSQSDGWTKMKADNFGGMDIVTASGENIVREATTNGSFVDIAPYLDRMPNLKSFINSNSIVKQSVFTGDKMYYVPYFDGYDDLERMFMMRIDWVEKLLDSPEASLTDTKTLAATHYEAFMPATMSEKTFKIAKADGSATQDIKKSYAKNIVTLQNELATKSGAELTKALRAYIDSTYGNAFTKRSELFCGVNAAYDADELIALLRCVKTSPLLLTGSATTDIVPFYPRANTGDRVQNLAQLASIWGVRGLDARNAHRYIDENNTLQDARLNADTWLAMDRINQLYKEGLILESFNAATATSGDNNGDGTHRGRLNAQNRGFMTNDYNQTTTVHNNLGDGTTPAIAGFNLTPVLPPFTDWGYGDGKYVRFTDSWRSVKQNGWAVVNNIGQDKIERALALMDYLFSAEGNRLMSYGPEAWIDGTIVYDGKQVPKLSDKAIKELADYGKGNYTNYYRRFLGATFPIGYVKEQGMEYQCVHEKGRVGLDNILKAIDLGVVSHLVLNTEDAKGDSRLLTVPTTLPLSSEEQAYVLNNCAKYTSGFNIESSNGSGAAGISSNIYITIMLNGLGADYTGSDISFTGSNKAARAAAIVETLKNGDGYKGSQLLGFEQDAYDSIKNIK